MQLRSLSHTAFTRLLRFSFGVVLSCVLSAPLPATVRIVRSGTSAALAACVAPGGTVRFELDETASPSRADDRYQWLFNDQPIAGATEPCLELANVSAAQSGNYTLRRIDRIGDTEPSNTLALNVVFLPAPVVDATYVPQLPAGTTTARPVAAWPDGSLLVEASNQNLPARDFFRLLPDGTRDPAFHLHDLSVTDILPDHSVITTTSPYWYAPDGSVRPITLPPGFAAGQFLTAVRGTADGSFYLAQGSRMARFTAAGVLDAGFSCTLANNESIQSIAPEKLNGGIILVVAKNDSGYQVPIELVRVGADGTRDPLFATLSGYEMQYSVFPLANGRMLVRWLFEGGQHNGWYLLEANGQYASGWGVDSVYDGSPYRYVVDDRGIIYEESVNDSSVRRKTVTATGLALDQGFLTTGLAAPVPGTVRDFLLAPDGWLYVGQTIGGGTNEPRQALTRLRTNQSASGYGPAAVIVPESGYYTPMAGDELRLSASVTSDSAVTYQWLALDGQPLPSDPRSATLVIGNFGRNNLGRYQLRVTNAYGTALSDPFDARAAHRPRLVNVSGRAQAGTGENTIAAGLATYIRYPELSGRTLLRGAGPALRAFGIADALPSPVLTLFDSQGISRGTNDRWSADPDVAYVSGLVGASPFAADSADTALLSDLPSGNYTFHVNDRGGQSGIALLEVYQATDPDLQVLLNLSFRARTAPGNSTAIAGFVVDDPAGYGRSTRVLLRAIGPTLSAQGITHPLANPVLTLFDRTANVIATNDDWAVNNKSADAAALTATMRQVGAFDLPTDSKDAVLLMDLAPGAYTMHATGGDGVVLLEIYLVR